MLCRDYSGLTDKQWKKIDPPMLPPRNVEVQQEVMEETHQIFDGLELTHWIADGELVNIYRDGKLQPHNQDIDFICRAEELVPKCKAVVKALLSSGYAVRAFKRNTRVNAYKNGEMVSLQGYVLKGKFRWLKNHRIPSRYLEEKATIDFCGVTYRCPHPVEKFLSWKYKNWRKEYRGDTKLKAKYLNKPKLVGHK